MHRIIDALLATLALDCPSEQLFDMRSAAAVPSAANENTPGSGGAGEMAIPSQHELDPVRWQTGRAQYLSLGARGLLVELMMLAVEGDPGAPR